MTYICIKNRKVTNKRRLCLMLFLQNLSVKISLGFSPVAHPLRSVWPEDARPPLLCPPRVPVSRTGCPFVPPPQLTALLTVIFCVLSVSLL